MRTYPPLSLLLPLHQSALWLMGRPPDAVSGDTGPPGSGLQCRAQGASPGLLHPAYSIEQYLATLTRQGLVATASEIALVCRTAGPFKNMSGRNCLWSVTLRSENFRAGLQRTNRRKGG